MTPPSNVVPIETARLAIDVAELRGELALLTSSVGQRIDVLTTMVNNIQHGQMLAGEERLKQLALLTQLTERTSALPGAHERVQALELKVSHWRGVVVGFGIAISLLVGSVVYVYQTDRALVNSRIDANTASIRALERGKP